MQRTGTIYSDGRILFDGFVPMNWRLLYLSDRLLVHHAPGGTWYDNGGRHYGGASIEIDEIEDLRLGNEPGTWRFTLKMGAIDGSVRASFHPTPKTACFTAADELERHGAEIAERIRKRKET